MKHFARLSTFGPLVLTVGISFATVAFARAANLSCEPVAESGSFEDGAVNSGNPNNGYVYAPPSRGESSADSDLMTGFAPNTRGNGYNRDYPNRGYSAGNGGENKDYQGGTASYGRDDNNNQSNQRYHYGNANPEAAPWQPNAGAPGGW